MNDFSELEAELKALRPVAPSADLTVRVEQALAAAPVAADGVLPRRKLPMNWISFGMGLAAAAALLLLARLQPDTPRAGRPVATNVVAPRARNASAQSHLYPDGVTRVLYDQQNEGLLYPSDLAQPVRRLRSRSHETLHWKDPATGASLRVSYPTEEIELIPVAGQ